MANDKTILIWIVAIIAVLAVAIPKQDWSFTAAAADPTTSPYFALKFIDYPTVVGAGATVTYTVKVVNTGQAGFLQVDSGIYAKGQIESWGYPVSSLFAIQPASVAVKDQSRNCVESETNVRRKIVELNKGDETIATFTVKAPTDPCGEYYLHVGSFKACYADDPVNGGYLTTKVARTPIKVSGTCAKTVTPSTTKTAVPSVSGTTTGVSGTNASASQYASQVKGFWNDLGTIGKVVAVVIGFIIVLFLVIPGQKS